VNDETAAALPNPGVSAWLSLAFRGKLMPDENVLILGATGVTGKLAVRMAKLLGAGRVVAAGGNQQVLSTLGQLGADATIRLDALRSNFARRLCARCGRGYRSSKIVSSVIWGLGEGID
jgi:NADPH2:quinone reductase